MVDGESQPTLVIAPRKLMTSMENLEKGIRRMLRNSDT